MVPYRRSTNQPLLPFEKRLIAELGCSDEEYRQFSDHIRQHPYVRPAEYAHVPDVRNDPLTVAIVSLVIGLASTAASFLLAPKPQQFDQKRSRNRQLGGQQGTDIYAPSFGFDSIQNLAEYGSIVPICFTKQEQHVDENGTAFISGGQVITPNLVWSRIKSWGSYQIAELVMIAGQGDMPRPELSGIFLGNNALNSVYEEFFDFYWNGGYEALAGGSRLRGQNLRYGRLSSEIGLAPGDDAFTAPTLSAVNQAAFSGALTPSNQTTFGVYRGIPNGTPFRPNWEIVSVLEGDYMTAEQRAEQRHIYKKYVDPYLKNSHPQGRWGMPGTGRNYARRVGIISLNGQGITENRQQDKYGTFWTNVSAELEVNEGDEITVLLGRNRQETVPFQFEDNDDKADLEPLRLDDIRSAVEDEMRRYDDQFALGAKFMIGHSTWQVIERPSDPYDPKLHSDDGYRIRLKCLEAWTNNNRVIGVVARDFINKPKAIPYADLDETFYPICEYDMATVLNNRPCDVTEIGIKSQVWSRFNGLTNFNTIPAPFFLNRYNKKGIAVRAGTMNSYARRTSFFFLDVRNSNNEPWRDYNRNEGWVAIGPYAFAVTGSSPQDIYSFIRITHPTRSQLEFRFRPITSAIFGQQADPNLVVFELDGGRPGLHTWEATNYVGTFRVMARGRQRTARDLFTHSEMTPVPEAIGDVTYGEWRTTGEVESAVLSRIVYADNVQTVVTDKQEGSALTIATYAKYGSPGRDPYFDNLPDGTTESIEGWNSIRDGKEVYMTVNMKSYARSYADTPRNKWWNHESVTVVSSSNNWQDGDTFYKSVSLLSGTQIFFEYEVTTKKEYVQLDQPRSSARLFEAYSAIAEVSHYGDLITRSCDNGPEHEVVYVNECLSEEPAPQYDNCAVVGLKIRSGNMFGQLDQVRVCIKNGIEVERLVDGDRGSSNLLTDFLWYLCTDTDTGAGAIINSALVDRDALIETGRFLRANQLFFDDVIAEPTNIRSWLAEKAPSMLCYLTLKNGRIAIEPAVPYDPDSYKIDGDRPVKISAMFTEGNIIEGSFTLEWLELEDRKDFQAAVRYRRQGNNRLPGEETVIVRYADAGSSSYPIEEFDLPHVSHMGHAIKAARYFLAIRKYVTHTVTFQSLPWGMSLAPGQYIRVATESSPYNPVNNGIVKPDGTIIAATTLSDGEYSVYFWERDQQEVASGTLQVSGGLATNLKNCVFSVINTNVANQVYQVEALDVDENGIVTIKASSFPVDASNRSLIGRDVLDLDGSFEAIGAAA
jgi:hypothetical protein